MEREEVAVVTERAKMPGDGGNEGMAKKTKTKAAEKWTTSRVKSDMPVIKDGQQVLACVTAVTYGQDIVFQRNFTSGGAKLQLKPDSGRGLAEAIVNAVGKTLHDIQNESLKDLMQVMKLRQQNSEEGEEGMNGGGENRESNLWSSVENDDEDALRGLHGDLQQAAQPRGRGRSAQDIGDDLEDGEHVMLSGIELRNADDVSRKYGIFRFALNNDEEATAKKILQVKNTAQTNCQLYKEILPLKPRSDTVGNPLETGVDTVQDDRCVSRKAAAVRTWLWLVGSIEGDNGDVTLDLGLDALMRRNRKRKGDMEAQELSTRPRKKFRQQHCTDKIYNPYQLVSSVWPTIEKESTVLTECYNDPDTVQMFHSKAGAVQSNSMFNNDLMKRLMPERFHMSHILDPVNSVADFREPQLDVQLQFPEQNNLANYFASSPDFPEDYSETYDRLLQEQITAKTDLTEQWEDIKAQYTESKNLANEIQYVLSTEGNDGFSESGTGSPGGVYVVEGTNYTAEELKVKSQEVLKKCKDLIRRERRKFLEIKEAEQPLEKYKTAVWNKTEEVNGQTRMFSPWRYGICFQNMPVQVMEQCFYQIPWSNYSHSASLFDKVHFGAYWELELSKDQQIAYSSKPRSANPANPQSRLHRKEYSSLHVRPSNGEAHAHFDEEEIQNQLDQISHLKHLPEELTEAESNQQPLRASQFVVQQCNDETYIEYFKTIDYSDSACNRFSRDKASVVDDWESVRDKVRAGTVPKYRFKPFHEVQGDMAVEYVQRYCTDADSDATVTEMMAHLTDPDTGLFGKAKDLLRFEVTMRMDASADFGDEMHQQLLQLFTVAKGTVYMQRPGAIMTHCVMDSCNPRATMRMNFLAVGPPGNGKSFLLDALKEVMPPSVLISVSGESAAAHKALKVDNTGGESRHEMPHTVAKIPGKGDGMNPGADSWKMRMSEGVCINDAGGCAQLEDGFTVHTSTREKRVCRKVQLWCVNSVNIDNEINTAVGDRMWIYNTAQLATKDNTAALQMACDSQAGKEIRDSDPLGLYFENWKLQNNSWCFLTHIMGLLGYYGKGTFTMDMTCFDIVFRAFNNMNRKRGLPDMSNRQAHRAKHLCESNAMQRINGRLFCMPHSAFGKNGRDFQIRDMFTDIRLLELRMVVTPADAFKAVISVMSTDRTDEVAIIMRAVAQLVLDESTFTYSRMFGDRIERENDRRFRGDANRIEDIENGRANVDLNVIKLPTERNEKGLIKLGKMIADKAKGVKFSPAMVVNVLRFMDQSTTWGSLEHLDYDVGFRVDRNEVITLLQCKANEQANHAANGQFKESVITNANLDKTYNIWKHKYHKPTQFNTSRSQKGAIFFPFENPACANIDSMDTTIQECTRNTKTFNFDTIKQHGYLTVATHLISLALTEGISEKAADELVKEVSSSHITSGYYLSPGIGMASIDPEFPNVADGYYIKNNPDKTVIYPNLKHVDSDNHQWLGGNVSERDEACASLVTCREPDKPVASVVAHGRVKEVMEHSNILTTVHTLFQADYDECIRIIGPGVLYSAFGTRFMKQITGENYDPCEAPRKRQERPHTSRDLLIALQQVLKAPPEEGGYLDFMRHLNPWKTGRDAVIARSPRAEEELKRIVNEVSLELMTLYQNCPYEGCLYERSLNSGDLGNYLRKVKKRSRDLTELLEKHPDAPNAPELQKKRKQIIEEQSYAKARVEGLHAKRQRLLKRRGIDPNKFNNILDERKKRNDRHGEFSPEGHVAWKRKVAKELLVWRKYINKALATDVEIPQEEYDRILKEIQEAQ